MHYIHHLVQVANKESRRNHSTLFQHMLLIKVHDDLLNCIGNETYLFYILSTLDANSELFSEIIFRLQRKEGLS